MESKNIFSPTYRIINDNTGKPKVIVCRMAMSVYSNALGSIYCTAVGKSVCSSDDLFKENSGKKLALARAQKKLLSKICREIGRRNDKYKAYIKANDDMMATLMRMWASASKYEDNIIESFTKKSYQSH